MRTREFRRTGRGLRQADVVAIFNSIQTAVISFIFNCIHYGDFFPLAFVPVSTH